MLVESLGTSLLVGKVRGGKFSIYPQERLEDGILLYHHS